MARPIHPRQVRALRPKVLCHRLASGVMFPPGAGLHRATVCTTHDDLHGMMELYSRPSQSHHPSGPPPFVYSSLPLASYSWFSSFRSSVSSHQIVSSMAARLTLISLTSASSSCWSSVVLLGSVTASSSTFVVQSGSVSGTGP